MKVFDLNGELILQTDSSEGYTMIYITGVENNIVKVVCDAIIDENKDPYGRSRFNFSLNLNTGEWKKTV